MESTPVRAAELRRNCATCDLRELCLPRSLSLDDIAAVNALVSNRILQRGEVLYSPGQPLRHIYVVRSGSVEVHLDDASGIEQVIGFYLPGDLLGLDALQSGQHATGSRALEASKICAIPYYRLEELAALVPQLNYQLRRLMSKEVGSERHLVHSRGPRDLEEHLAAFLLDLSRRWEKLGYSGMHFRLTMSRDQLANYLGSAAASISYMFRRLQDAGILHISGTEITLLNLPKLYQVAGQVQSEAQRLATSS